MDQLDDAEVMLLRDPFAEYHAMYKALSDTAEHKQLPTPNSKSSFKGRMAKKVSPHYALTRIGGFPTWDSWGKTFYLRQENKE